MIKGTTKNLGVMGWPIAHSLSPVLHGAAFAALGLDWTYERIECDGAAAGNGRLALGRRCRCRRGRTNAGRSTLSPTS